MAETENVVFFNFKKLLSPYIYKWLRPGKGISIKENADGTQTISATGGGEGGGTTIITAKIDPGEQLVEGDYWFEEK
jgi:hypothetical protein